jgi:hypothetical protein
MCDFLVEMAISETYFKFWPLKFRLTSTTECPQIMKSEKNMSPKQAKKIQGRCKGVHVIERPECATHM